MIFVLLSVLCSVLVSVQLKLAQRRGLDMPTLVTFNYLAASLACALLLRPDWQAVQIGSLPWLRLLLLASVLPAIFLVMAASVREAGIVRTDIAQRLSLLLSLPAAFVWFGERWDGWKLAGLALGMLAMVAILIRSRAGAATHAGPRQWWLPLLVLLGYATVDILLKQVAQGGTPFALSLQIAFVVALLLMLGLLAWRRLHGGHRLRMGALAVGLLVGLTNFGNILFYVKAHRALPDSPAVVFASMNLGVVVLGTWVGTGLFGERLQPINKAGIALAVVAIALIAFSLARPGG